MEKLSETVPAPLVAVLRVLLVVLGLLLAPPVFQNLFAMGDLLVVERNILAAISVVFVLLGFWLAIFSLRAQRIAVLCSLSIVLVAPIELAVRAGVRMFGTREMRDNLSKISARTYPDRAVYVGHPFLLFTGNPLRGYSNLGFPGVAVPFEKPSGVVRLAFVGGSTTEDGYPRSVQQELNGASHGSPAVRFESVNFGLSGYTSAQSVINLVLNIQDFSPDYLVIHDGWNEMSVRQDWPDFRNDYSHAFHPFSEPFFYDRYLIRVSVAYRMIKEGLTPVPAWRVMRDAVAREFVGPSTQKKLENLEPFRRNVRTMIDFGSLRGMRVVILTVPHSSNTEMQWYEPTIHHMTQVNEILRTLAREYGDRIVFVDLEREIAKIPGNHFADVGHFNVPGMQVKAGIVAKAILDDYHSRHPAEDSSSATRASPMR